MRVLANSSSSSTMKELPSSDHLMSSVFLPFSKKLWKVSELVSSVVVVTLACSASGRKAGSVFFLLAPPSLQLVLSAPALVYHLPMHCQWPPARCLRCQARFGEVGCRIGVGQPSDSWVDGSAGWELADCWEGSCYCSWHMRSLLGMYLAPAPTDSTAGTGRRRAGPYFASTCSEAVELVDSPQALRLGQLVFSRGPAT